MSLSCRLKKQRCPVTSHNWQILCGTGQKKAVQPFNGTQTNKAVKAKRKTDRNFFPPSNY
ncbi:MAG TPA: hypothetical protein DEO65_03705 [Bacillus bacterium]|uniref:Ribosomal protein S18 n=1 Tax=Siminovitchia fordii TaxID=254759 RepID=A0ABQ4K2G6_9BACI|nr:hypothetical protein J1TS3_10910 [Siminovitchia fordii]HBZ08978.1 hypothetical protein [Bacillus sp. (in: firmicutes)]